MAGKLLQEPSVVQPQTYTVLDQNLPRLKGQIDHLNRRARKLGCDPTVLTIVETVLIPSPRGSRSRTKVVAHIVTVEGRAPRIPGFVFVATLEHTEAGTIVRQVPGATQEGELSRFRVIEAWCEHCQTQRDRHDTYVIRSETDGILRQVGRSCLKDYTGHPSPEALAQLAGLIADLDRDLDDYGTEGFGRPVTRFDTSAFLAEVSAAIRASGWLSRTKARETDAMSTASQALASLQDRIRGKTSRDRGSMVLELVERDYERAVSSLAWAREHLVSLSRLSDYEHNLTLAIRAETVDERGAGLAASVLGYVEREQAKLRDLVRAREEGRESRFVGAEGEKIEMPVTILSRHTFDGDYGPRTAVNMQDLEGNRLVWWYSGYLDDENEVGSAWLLSGTVKRHGRNRKTGENETTVFRCSFTNLAVWTAQTHEPCPSCGAPSGSWCRTKKGNKTKLHARRPIREAPVDGGGCG